MESETKLPIAQESKRPSEKNRARRATVESLSEDEEVITVRAPIAKLIAPAKA